MLLSKTPFDHDALVLHATEDEGIAIGSESRDGTRPDNTYCPLLNIRRQQLVYGASKAAAIMITKATALELAERRIRVNAIAPGWVDTPGNKATGRIEAAAASIPVGRVAQPDEIARWVWLLTASGDAGFMTGETITLSGGDAIR